MNGLGREIINTICIFLVNKRNKGRSVRRRTDLENSKMSINRRFRSIFRVGRDLLQQSRLFVPQVVKRRWRRARAMRRTRHRRHCAKNKTNLYLISDLVLLFGNSEFAFKNCIYRRCIQCHINFMTRTSCTEDELNF